MKLIITILLSLLVFPLSAQDDQDWPLKLSDYNVLDSSRVECVYMYMERCKNETVFHNRILLLGDKHSVYRDYGRFRVDSCIESQPNRKWMFSESMKLGNEYGEKNISFFILKDKNSTKINYYNNVVLDHYHYVDSCSFNWKISNEKMEVCGYKCRKATCDFRGRKWTVWFTNKIPISDGPWKFCGLPGLILRAEDETHDQVFYATCIRKGRSPMYVDDFHYMPIAREKYNKAIKAYRDNPSSYWGDSFFAGKDEKGNKLTIAKYLPYNPLELE